MSTITRFLKNESGVAATEFALVAPILIFLLIGVFDYGMLVRERMKMENIANSAADYMVAGGDEDYLAEDLLQNYFPDDDEQTVSTISIETERVCECESGSSISCEADICSGGESDYKRQFQTVEVSRPYQLLFAYPGLEQEQVLRGRARMQVR